jgi:hypothetical protein
MAILQGDPLPDVKTTTTQVTTAPDYYNKYLADIAAAGSAAATMDPTKMVAGFTDLQNKGFGATEAAAGAGMGALTDAQNAARIAAGGVTPDQIQQFMNPYTRNVVDEMARLSQQNLQRNVLPGLKGAFAGTGGFGSRRMFDTTGQTLADIQANLTGQQQKALESGYNTSLDAALRNLGLVREGATTLGNLGRQEQEMGLTGAKSMLDAGSLQQALEQAKIEAPLKMASNAAQLLRGYQVPTSTEQTFVGPMPGAYGTSPLAAITGLASLFGSAKGGSSAAEGIMGLLKGIKDVNWSDYFPDFGDFGEGDSFL